MIVQVSFYRWFYFPLLPYSFFLKFIFSGDFSRSLSASLSFIISYRLCHEPHVTAIYIGISALLYTYGLVPYYSLKRSYHCLFTNIQIFVFYNLWSNQYIFLLFSNTHIFCLVHSFSFPRLLNYSFNVLCLSKHHLSSSINIDFNYFIRLYPIFLSVDCSVLIISLWKDLIADEILYTLYEFFCD